MSTDTPAAVKWYVPYLPWLTRLAVALLAAGVGAAGHWLGADPVTVEKVVEVVREAPASEFDIDRHGAQADAEADAADQAQAVFRTFADTPAGAATDLPKQVFGWKPVEILTGRPAPMKDQNPTGACVGFGTTTAVERTLAAEILARRGDPSEFGFFSEEVTYAGSKVQGARSLGAGVSRSDGSSGVFAKAWLTSVGGMVPKGRYGALDLTTYDPARARSWNLSGCPADLVPVAKRYPVRDSVKVANWQQCKQALASGYGVSGCANWAFARQRDANGVAAPTDEGWDHCMAIDGYCTDPATNREYGHVENSWSNLPDRAGRRTGQTYHTGPVGWGNPTGAGFWAPAESLDRALRQGMSYAYSGVTGFPKRIVPLDWNVRAAPRGGLEIRAQVAPRLRPIDLFARGESALAW